MGQTINAYKILVIKPEGKRPVKRPRHRWEDSVTMGLECVDWVHLAQDRYQWQALIYMLMSL